VASDHEIVTTAVAVALQEFGCGVLLQQPRVVGDVDRDFATLPTETGMYDLVDELGEVCRGFDRV